ncbi:putative acetyltransferase [Tsuneonella dongtanensis]|uniref:Putative acetyltransferase n=1 Tax=Tsuneonella dongtanensis TaxID=692370 RepID=A0A1B2A9K3_9SPHN|nr:N-acetyltransferase [Tsuneonella dongtanensis]ANY18840.1 putative acetyltransferase [Tsuneonella dongtanensis]
MSISIRPERPGDERAIHSLTEAAFRTQPHSDGTEQDVIDRLRRDGDLALSLVAEGDGRIVGHIAFSGVKIADGSRDWYGLGPVSVWPELHGKGIGSALIVRGIADLKDRGARGMVLLGNPEYYGRFGFEHDPSLEFPGPPAPYFQRLVLADEPPRGIVTYAPAFY